LPEPFSVDLKAVYKVIGRSLGEDDNDDVPDHIEAVNELLNARDKKYKVKGLFQSRGNIPIECGDFTGGGAVGEDLLAHGRVGGGYGDMEDGWVGTTKRQWEKSMESKKLDIADMEIEILQDNDGVRANLKSGKSGAFGCEDEGYGDDDFIEEMEEAERMEDESLRVHARKKTVYKPRKVNEKDDVDTDVKIAKTRRAVGDRGLTTREKSTLQPKVKRERLAPTPQSPIERSEDGDRQLSHALSASSSSQSEFINSELELEAGVSVHLPIAKVLKAHQKDAVAWLWARVVDKKAGGCLLAHHMGLGKTLTSIAVAHTFHASPALKKRHPGARKTLVICPTNVVDNWTAECAKWDPNHMVPATNYNNLPSSLRVKGVQSWFTNGGILVISDTLFKSAYKNSEPVKDKTTQEMRKPEQTNLSSFKNLCNADLVVADEAHMYLKT